MRKILFNYSDRNFKKSQELNTKTALEVGKFNIVHQFDRSMIDKEFAEKNADILRDYHGGGLWIWKYYFANKMLENPDISEDDIIFYSDSGCTFINSIDHLVDVFRRDNLSVMTFYQLLVSEMYTKRDLFLITGCDEAKYRDTCMRVGGWWMFKKDEKSRAFFRDMLHYAQIPGVLDQNPSRLAPEVDCFLGNSFDEALISVIAKKHDLPVYRAPHQNGIMEIANASRNELTKESYQRFLEEGPENLEDFNKVAPHTNYAAVTTTFEQYPPLEKDDRSTYPQIIHLHRGRDAALNINERPY